MAEALIEKVRSVRAALVDFYAEVYSGEECAVLVEELATLEKVCVAARVRAAGRAGAAGAHRERGFADVSDWLARASGTSTSSAKTALDTAAALEEQPEIKAALQTGDLSLAQVRELVKTEEACPGSAAELLDVARGQSLKTLKEQARDRRVRAIDPEELHRLQHAAMHHRQWITALGTIAYAGELPPEFGIPIANRINAETDRLWRRAKRETNNATDTNGTLNLGGDTDQKDRGVGRQGSATNGKGGAGGTSGTSGTSATGGTSGIGGKSGLPRRAALAAQAFVRLVETGGKGKARAADLVIVCDLETYRRGHALEGETCHIVGGGPIPVSVAQELGRDAFLKAVLHNGTELHTIAHFGRKTSAVLRTALTLGAPPLFDGIKCSIPGCDRRYYLEQDHINPVDNGGFTALDNLQPLCWHHHLIKTEHDRNTGRIRGTQPKPSKGPKRDKRRKPPNGEESDPTTTETDPDPPSPGIGPDPELAGDKSRPRATRHPSCGEPRERAWQMRL